MSYGLEDQGFVVRFPVKANTSIFQSVLTCSGAIQWVLGEGARFFPLEQSGWGVKLTTHFHVVLNLRMSGTMPLHTPYAFMHKDNFNF
jgi:hypothetical protein